MNPELDKILKQAYQDMDAKGVPEAQRKQLLTKLATDFSASQGGTENKDEGLWGFAKDFGASMAKPFDKVGRAFLTDAVPFLTFGASEEYKKAVEPYKEGAPKDALDLAGNVAEVASYGLAPLKLGGGLWNMAKSIAPAAGTFAAGKGAQELSKTGDPMKAAGSAVGNYVGVTAGFGLMKGAGDFIKSFGARALQSPAVQTAFAAMKENAENVFSSASELFQKGAGDLANITNATTRRTVNALRSQFDKDYDRARDAVIDSMVPEIKTPDLTLGKFQRSLSEKMGNMFRETNTLYDDVKADNTSIAGFTRASGALSKLPEAPKIGSKASAEELKSFMQQQASMSPAIRDFAEQMSASLQSPLTLRQVMRLWEQSMSYIPKANNEERVLIRDFAAGLYADARSVLQKQNPELLNQWDLAYQSFKKAGDVYESNVLGNLKTVGDVDTFVDKMLGKELTRPERNAFLKAVGTEDTAVQDMFINSVLRKAKELKPNDGAKLIRNFLDNWGDNFLSADQAKMLDDTASFLSGNFDEFVLGIRNLQGLTDETAEALQGQAEQLDVTKMVDDTRLSDISNKFTKLKDSPELEKIMESFTPEEKNVVAMSITKDLFNKELPVLSKSPDGTFKVEEQWAEAMLKTWDQISNNKTLQKAFTPEQLKGFEKAVKEAELLHDVSFQNESQGVAKVTSVILGLLLAAKGWLPSAFTRISPVFQSAQGEAARKAAIKKMVDEGMLKNPGGNAPISYSLGWFFDEIAKLGGGQATTKVLEETFKSE